MSLQTSKSLRLSFKHLMRRKKKKEKKEEKEPLKCDDWLKVGTRFEFRPPIEADESTVKTYFDLIYRHDAFIIENMSPDSDILTASLNHDDLLIQSRDVVMYGTNKSHRYLYEFNRSHFKYIITLL